LMIYYIYQPIYRWTNKNTDEIAYGILIGSMANFLRDIQTK